MALLVLSSIASATGFPSVAASCELISTDHVRHSLEAVMNLFDPKADGALRIEKTSLPGIGGVYTGKDHTVKGGGNEATFFREEGALGTGLILKFFKHKKPSATISVIKTDNVDDTDPVLLAGGVCKLREIQ
ncbi:MAG TPA: hypothetical protein VF475_04435 [Sphingobium sp.]